MTRYLLYVLRTFDRKHIKRTHIKGLLCCLLAFCVVAAWSFPRPCMKPLANALSPAADALTYVVDRLEGDWAVLIEEAQVEKNVVVVPVSSLPDESAEGTTLTLSVLPNPGRPLPADGGRRSYAYLLDLDAQYVTCQLNGYPTVLPRVLFSAQVRTGSLITLLFQRQESVSSPGLLVAERKALEFKGFTDSVVDLSVPESAVGEPSALRDTGGERETGSPL